MDLSIKIGNNILTNPIGVASGTFGYGSEYESLVDFSKIGALYTKAVTLKPRPGNDIPRIIETPSGLLNSIGLANVGVERFIKEKVGYLQDLPCAVIANIAGSTEDEYIRVVERIESEASLFGYEVNLSCPNVKHGALAFGTDPDQVEQITQNIRKITKKPLIIKLTPNVTDITSIAQAAESGGADAVSCINTLVGMVIDPEKKKPVLPRGTGGLSGPAIRPVGVAMTYKVAKSIKIPVIGIGGIMNTSDALQYLLVGASAIQIGTAVFVDPEIPGQILDGLSKYCQNEKIQTVKQIAEQIKIIE